jgi:hypothetical protein
MIIEKILMRSIPATFYAFYCISTFEKIGLLVRSGILLFNAPGISFSRQKHDEHEDICKK